MKERGVRTVALRIPGCKAVEITGPRRLHVLGELDRAGGLKGFEPETISCAYACLGSRRGTFYDIGANIGVFSLAVSGAFNVDTVAFEPTPVLADVLEKTIRDSRLPIHLRRTALSDETGKVNFYLSPRSDASNSLNSAFRPGGRAIEVNSDTLDNQANAPPALIKIDVESAEPRVLRGAVETIREHRPFMIVEVLRPSIADEINSIMEQYGYYFYHITGGGLGKALRTLPREVSSKDRNWLFAPEPLGALFRARVWLWRLRLRML